MPITPDAFIRANEFDAAFAAAQLDPEDVPAYNAEHLSLADIAASTDLELPLSHWVWGKPHVRRKSDRQQAIVTLFHTAVKEKNSELVLAMVRRGVVSPDVPDVSKQTPLATAVREGNLHMVKLLLDLGAAVNTPIRSRNEKIPQWKRRKFAEDPPEIERTPLMLAAADGRLAIVKLLMDAGADDGIIAPDGQMALRLAADGGHREIVDYLPLRRGGALRRWMVHNGQALDRIQRAADALYRFVKAFVWVIPKFFLFDLPNMTLKGMASLAKWTWKKVRPYGSQLRAAIARLPDHLRAAAQWLWRSLQRLPGILKTGVEATGRWLKAAVQHTWAIVQELPAALASIAHQAGKATWRAAKWCGHQVIAMPSYVVAAARWTRDAAVTAGRWAGRATIAISRFVRSAIITVAKFLWRAICALPAAVSMVWKWLKTSATAIGRALVALLATPIALLHTAALAVVSLIRRARSVTLADLWAGLVAVARAVIDLPRQVWRAFKSAVEMGLEVSGKVFGVLGAILYIIVVGIAWGAAWLALFIPRQVLKMLKAVASSLSKGGHEVAVWINPKW